MKQLQVREKEGEWLPFCDEEGEYFNPQKMMEGIAKNYPRLESRMVDVAVVLLPQALKDRLATMKDVEITQVSEKGVLVKYKKTLTGIGEVRDVEWANILAWDGTLLGAGDYRTEETIFNDRNLNP